MAGEQTEDDQIRAASRDAPIDQPWLFLVAEGDRPLAGGARFALREVERVLFGRGEARGASREGRTLRVSLPGRTISTLHARLVPTHGALVVEDARSRNGTFVDGVRVVRAALAPGSVLEIGRACFVVSSLPAPRSVGDLDPLETAPDLPGFSTLRPSSSSASTPSAGSRGPTSRCCSWVRPASGKRSPRAACTRRLADRAPS